MFASHGLVLHRVKLVFLRDLIYKFLGQENVVHKKGKINKVNQIMRINPKGGSTELEQCKIQQHNV